MSKRKILTRSQHAKEAAKARSNLNMAYAIIILCEGSLFNGCPKFEEKIINICKTQAQKMLVEFDYHVYQIEEANA